MVQERPSTQPDQQRGEAGASPAQQPAPASADAQQNAQPPELNLAAISELIANHDASALQQMAQNRELPFSIGLRDSPAPAEQPAPQPVFHSLFPHPL